MVASHESEIKAILDEYDSIDEAYNLLDHLIRTEDTASLIFLREVNIRFLFRESDHLLDVMRSLVYYKETPRKIMEVFEQLETLKVSPENLRNQKNIHAYAVLASLHPRLKYYHENFGIPFFLGGSTQYDDAHKGDLDIGFINTNTFYSLSAITENIEVELRTNPLRFTQIEVFGIDPHTLTAFNKKKPSRGNIEGIYDAGADAAHLFVARPILVNDTYYSSIRDATQLIQENRFSAAIAFGVVNDILRTRLERRSHF